MNISTKIVSRVGQSEARAWKALSEVLVTARQRAVLAAVHEGRVIRFDNKENVLFDTVGEATRALCSAIQQGRRAQTVRTV